MESLALARTTSVETAIKPTRIESHTPPMLLVGIAVTEPLVEPVVEPWLHGAQLLESPFNFLIEFNHPKCLEIQNLQLFGMLGLKSSNLEMGFVELGNGSKKVFTFVGN